MNNWNELDSYARGKVETRRHEAEEWRLARLAQSHTPAMGTGARVRFSLPQTLVSLVARLRTVWLGA
jgi:hypothetical protein